MKNSETKKISDFKRFLEPIFKEKLIFYRGWGVFILWGINATIHVLFLEKIVSALDLGDKEMFLHVIYLYLGYLIIWEALFWLTSKVGWTIISNSAIKIIQKKYLPKFISVDNNYFESIGVGKGVSIINKGISTWARLIFSFIENTGYIIAALGITLYMLGKIGIIYPVIFLCLYIIFILVSYSLNKYVLKYRKKRIQYENTHTANLVRLLMSKNEILQSDKINLEINRLDGYQDKQMYYNNKMTYLVNGFYRIPSGSIIFLLFLSFLYFGHKYFMGEIELSLIVGLGGALILMQRSIVASVDYYKRFMQDFTDVTNFWDFFDNAPQIKGYEEGNNFIHKNGNIEIKNLNFGYHQDKQIFSDFSLKIEGEKVLALVGDSGSGKSTLVKMIAGYMRPNSGEIIVDEQKLSETSLKSYYKDIGYLTQDPSVFDGSIWENLTYALEKEVSEEKIKEIISLAKCEFIYELPNGLETQIGERGVKLSGGQKQRLAIAKIFLKDPKIIILDEPTSALDSFSEEQITKAMQNLFQNRTVIVIAHRLQTVKHADRILVLENGKVIEGGKHDELVKKDGKYAKMLELQSGF